MRVFSSEIIGAVMRAVIYLLYIREFSPRSSSVKHTWSARFSWRNETFPSRASQPIAMQTSGLGAPTPRSTALRLDSPFLYKKFQILPAVLPMSSDLHESIYFLLMTSRLKPLQDRLVKSFICEKFVKVVCAWRGKLICRHESKRSGLTRLKVHV
jgi:hypothetical protein